MGRRRAVEPSYREELNEIVLAVGRRGGSVAAMANACKVHRSFLYVLARNRPAFAVAFEKAKQLSQVYWENKGEKLLTSATFNHTIWQRIIRRFPDYRVDHRKTEQKHKATTPVLIERVVVTRSASAAD